MGFNFSRPQFEYAERTRASDYSRVYHPSDCYCGGPMHFRQRNVAVQRDPMMMDGMMGGGSRYGVPAMAMGMGMPQQTMTTTPAFGLNNISTVPGLSNTTTNGWPAEWKDPREWTTRDYDRLGEIMEEYLSRQRGRGVGSLLGGQQVNPYSSMPGMDSPWDGGSRWDRKSRRPRPSYSDLDQLREQMMRYAQEAKEHMQSVNDFLYGSEREQREERYRDRQRRMVEEILKGLSGAGRGNDASMLRPPEMQSALPGPGYPGGYPMGMSPSQGFMAGGHPTGGMPGMFPGAMDPMNQMNMYGGPMNGLPQRPSLSRPRRSTRPLGLGDGFEDQGGFDEFGGRRGRRNRRDFDAGDDMMDMGDGRRFPSGPYGPHRPRGGGGGGSSGAVFADDSNKRDGDGAARPQNLPAQFPASTSSRWAAYEPNTTSKQARYEASPPQPPPPQPPPPPPPRPDRGQQTPWSSAGYETSDAQARSQGVRSAYQPDRFDGRMFDIGNDAEPTRPHVSFQRSGSSAERPQE